MAIIIWFPPAIHYKDSMSQEVNSTKSTSRPSKAYKTFILRIDAETMGAIEKWAADEFRSTNGQLQWIITEALRKFHRLPKAKPTNGNSGITS